MLAAAVLMWTAAHLCLTAAAHAAGQSASLAALPATTAATPTPAPEPVAIDAADPALVRRWGIRVQKLRLTAAGYMLDFRYTVVDARKAKPLFERKIKPVLRDEATGAQLAVPVPPKTGALRNSNEPLAGRGYFMFFGNPARFLKAGSRVTITIGQFSVRGLQVEAE